MVRAVFLRRASSFSLGISLHARRFLRFGMDDEAVRLKIHTAKKSQLLGIKQHDRLGQYLVFPVSLPFTRLMFLWLLTLFQATTAQDSFRV